MFDGVLVDPSNRRSDEPLAAATLPWQGVALLLCLAILPVAAAILYPGQRYSRSVAPDLCVSCGCDFRDACLVLACHLKKSAPPHASARSSEPL